MSKVIRLIDRTRTTTDWKCPRARFWGYEYLGKGIVKSGTSLPLFVGIVTHDALAAIATFTRDGVEVPINEIADAAFQQIRDNLWDGSDPDPMAKDFAFEQATLTEGMIRGFYKHLWPKLMVLYPTIVSIEAEMEYILAKDDDIEFVFMTKPDLIVEDTNGELVYLEYKTTSSKQDKWINSWDTAVQLHSSVMATEATLGRRPAYVQIVGLYKGYESYGKQSSPFCYAYKKPGNPPFTQDQILYEYKAGFRRYATWELEGGVKAWVEGMPPIVLANQFPMTPPIMVNEDLINSFFAQRLHREKEIANTVWNGEYDNPTTGIDKVFPQKFDQCVPSFGWACEYRKLCHGQVKEPLAEGYELRTPHHQRELDAQGEV